MNRSMAWMLPHVSIWLATRLVTSVRYYSGTGAQSLHEIPEFVQFAGVLADCTLAELALKKNCSNKHSLRNWRIANA